MALVVGELAAILSLDKKGFDAGLVESEAAMEAADGSASKMGAGLQNLAKIGALAGAAVAASAVGVGVALFKVGSDFDDAYDKIATTTGKTGKELDGLDASARNVLASVPDNLDNVSTAIAGVNQHLDLNGAGLEKVSEQFLAVSRMTGTDLATNIDAGSKALQQFKVPQDQVSAGLDHLFKVSQSTGIGFDQLSQLMSDNGNVLQSLGYNFDESATLIGSLNKAGVDVEGTLGGMGRGLATLAKAGEAPKDTFNRLVNEIVSTKDPVEASQKAIELFGAKGGAKLAADLRSGALSIADLNASLENNQSTILGTDKKTWDWKERLEILKNKVLVALEPLAMRVFNGVGQAVESATPAIMTIVHWVTNQLVPALSDVASKALPILFDGLSKVGGFIFGTLVPALVTFGKWLVDHKPVLLGIAAAIGTVLVAAFVSWAIAAGTAAIATIAAVAPLYAPIAAVAAAVGLVVTAVIMAYQKWDWFHSLVDAIASFLVGTLWPALQSIAGVLVDVVGAAVSWLAGVWTDTLWPALQAVGGWIAGTLWPILQAVGGWIADKLMATVAALAAIWSNVLWPALQAVARFVSSFLLPVLEGVGIAIAIAVTPVVLALAWTWSNVLWPALKMVAGFIGSTVVPVIKTIATVVGDVVSWVGGRIGDLINIFKGIGGAIGGAISGLVDIFKKPFEMAFDAVKSLWNSTIGRISFTIPDWVPGVGGKGFSFPKMHTGGVVTAGPGEGAEVMRILKVGETVLTAGQTAALRSQMSALGATAGAQLAGTGAVSVSPAAAASAGQPIVVQFHGPVAGRDGERWVADTIRSATRRGLIAS